MPFHVVVQSSYLRYRSAVNERKERLTVTVDSELVRAGRAAVKAGQADSVSAWVNAALAEHAAKERRLAAMARAIAAYEARFGPILAHELSAQAQADRASARMVRGKVRKSGRGGRRRAA